MKEIIEAIKELQTLSGNAQLLQLNYRKSDLLKEVLLYTYDHHRKYKIDEGKYNNIHVEVNREQLILEEDDWNRFKELLDHLSEIKSAKDEDVYKTKSFMRTFSGDNYNFLKGILFKDLRLNMNIKKFQKVWPDFCAEPQVQLAEKLDGQEFKNGYYSRKLDGLRCYWLDGKAYSRSNKLHKEAPLIHIQKQMQLLEGFTDYVFDGELIYLEDGKEDFQKAVSLVRRDDRLVQCQNIYFIVFDMIPKEHFLAKTSWTCFEQEYECIKDYFDTIEPELSWYKTCLPNILVIRQVQEHERYILEEARNKYNWEGLMYRDGDSPYEYKRTNKLLKIKAMQDIELKLIGMEEGTGKHEGKLGAFIVQYENTTLKIGSGFSDEQRERYWNHKEDYIGKYVKTQYFEKTMNQDGTPSLRFPVFICFRDENTMEEYT